MRSRDRSYFESITNLYFVTSTIVGFVNVFDNDLYCIFIKDIEFYQGRGDFTIICYVLMPNHFHIIIKITGNDSISRCIGNLKRISSRHIASYLIQNKKSALLETLSLKALEEPSSDVKIWKPRFDCMTIVKEKTLIQKIEYCHLNPVRRGLVENPLDWPYSSARNYAETGEILLKVDNKWKSLGY